VTGNSTNISCNFSKQYQLFASNVSKSALIFFQSNHVLISNRMRVIHKKKITKLLLKGPLGLQGLTFKCLQCHKDKWMISNEQYYIKDYDFSSFFLKSFFSVYHMVEESHWKK